MLDCAAGLSGSEIAERHRTSQQTVSKWRGRFARERLSGLSLAGEAYLMAPTCFEALATRRDVTAATVRNRVVRLGRRRQCAYRSGSTHVYRAFRAVLADGSPVKGMVLLGEFVWEDNPLPCANASLVGKGRWSPPAGRAYPFRLAVEPSGPQLCRIRQNHGSLSISAVHHIGIVQISTVSRNAYGAHSHAVSVRVPGDGTRGRYRNDAVPRQAATFRLFTPAWHRAHPPRPERILHALVRRCQTLPMPASI